MNEPWRPIEKIAELKAENKILREAKEIVRQEIILNVENKEQREKCLRRCMLAFQRVRVQEKGGEVEAEKTYPCKDCGLPRTEAEGGTIFSVCDVCWDKHYEEKKGGEW